MTTTDLATIIGVNIALMGIFATILLWALNRMDNDIKNLSTDIKTATTCLDGHATRIDQLYKMFVDLLKERK